MQDQNMEIVNRLSPLLQLLNNARNGYTLAAEKEEDPAVKSSYQHFGNERDTYLEELKQLIKEKGGNVADIFSPEENPASSWMKVAGSDNKEATIAACIKAEKSVMTAYRAMMESGDLDENTQTILTKQLNGMDYAVRKISNHLTPTL